MRFEGFTGNDECTASDAIVAERTNIRHGLMDSDHSFEDISFDSDSNRVSFCLALEPGAAENGGDAGNIALGDVHGTVHPSGVPGFYIQDNDPIADAFLSGNCQASGGCAQFCPHACLRLVEFQASGSSVHEGTLMKVTDKSTGNFVLRPRHIISKTEMPTVNARWGIWLPGGSTYDVTWVDADGKATWPGYVYMSFDKEPSCETALKTTNVALDYPAPTHRCINPLFNGDLESGSVYGWQERTNYKPGMEIVSPGADSTSYALRTLERVNTGGSVLVNRVDISCLRAWAGESIRLRGKIRLQGATGSGEKVLLFSIASIGRTQLHSC